MGEPWCCITLEGRRSSPRDPSRIAPTTLHIKGTGADRLPTLKMETRLAGAPGPSSAVPPRSPMASSSVQPGELAARELAASHRLQHRDQSVDTRGQSGLHRPPVSSPPQDAAKRAVRGLARSHRLLRVPNTRFQIRAQLRSCRLLRYLCTTASYYS